VHPSSSDVAPVAPAQADRLRLHRMRRDGLGSRASGLLAGAPASAGLSNAQRRPGRRALLPNIPQPRRRACCRSFRASRSHRRRPIRCPSRPLAQPRSPGSTVLPGSSACLVPYVAPIAPAFSQPARKLVAIPSGLAQPRPGSRRCLRVSATVEPDVPPVFPSVSQPQLRRLRPPGAAGRRRRVEIPASQVLESRRCRGAPGSFQVRRSRQRRECLGLVTRRLPRRAVLSRRCELRPGCHAGRVLVIAERSVSSRSRAELPELERPSVTSATRTEKSAGQQHQAYDVERSADFLSCSRGGSRPLVWLDNAATTQKRMA